MSQHSAAGSVVSAAILGVTCVAGAVATAYTVTLAYLMGSRAQAAADDATPANPQVLLRLSMQELIDKVKGQMNQPINMEDDDVCVNDFDTEGAVPIDAEVVD